MSASKNEILNTYYTNNASKLRQVVDKILKNFGGLSNKDRDDFYSLANEVFTDVLHRYDSSQSFDGFLYSCLTNKIKTEMTRRNRFKRQGDRNSVSIDETDDNGVDLSEKISSDFDIDKKLDVEELLDEKTVEYLRSLSPIQRKIANLIMEGYEPKSIKEKLNITDKQYSNHMKHMTCEKQSRILKRTSVVDNEMEEKIMNNNHTFEKSKVEKLSIASIIKKMNNGTLRYDHPLQRESDQHSTKMKSNLMSDILQGNPIPALVFAEQVINGISITWNLDGKQRSTNVKDFVENKFKISKSVRRNMIKYQAIIKDEKGNIIPDEKGFPQAEWREFDIVNKRFSQLPDELKDKFLDYCFDITLYMNCSDEDIAYHIERYNDGKQMASSQKGIIKLGEDYARMIKGISAMPFFKENGFNFTQSKNGTIDRVCIESIMATEFLDKWKSSPEDIATFLKKNATEEHFDNLEDTVERLEKVVTEDVGELFDKKDSFIYFTVFARFKKTGLEDGKFIEFMTEYAQSLHSKFEEIENVTTEGKKRSTKDKAVVIDKINLVENLMFDYLGINSNDLESVDTLEFIKDNVNPNTTEEDVEFYSDMLDDLTLEVDNNTKLLDEHNRPSLIALVGYACENDIDLDEWIKQWFMANTMYSLNQKRNFEIMRDSIGKGAVA